MHNRPLVTPWNIQPPTTSALHNLPHTSVHVTAKAGVNPSPSRRMILLLIVCSLSRCWNHQQLSVRCRGYDCDLMGRNSMMKYLLKYPKFLLNQVWKCIWSSLKCGCEKTILHSCWSHIPTHSIAIIVSHWPRGELIIHHCVISRIRKTVYLHWKLHNNIIIKTSLMKRVIFQYQSLITRATTKKGAKPAVIPLTDSNYEASQLYSLRLDFRDRRDDYVISSQMVIYCTLKMIHELRRGLAKVSSWM